MQCGGRGSCGGEESKGTNIVVSRDAIEAEVREELCSEQFWLSYCSIPVVGQCPGNEAVELRGFRIPRTAVAGRTVRFRK